MPSESRISFKGRDIAVPDAYVIVYNLLLFEKIQKIYKNNSPEFNNLKTTLADDAIYMIVINDITGINYDKYLIGIENEFLNVIDDMLEDLKSEVLSKGRIDALLNNAKNYLLISNAKNLSLSNYPEKIESDYVDPMTTEIYIQAFEKINSFFKGKLDSSIWYIV